MSERPDGLFDREAEWAALTSFASRGRRGLGIVRGRRRHGKSALLRALATTGGHHYHQAIRGLASDQRRDLAWSFRDHHGGPLPAFETWDDAIGAILDAGGVTILDEVPYLTESAAELESVLQRHLDAAGDHSGALILSGSAMGVMTGLLLGGAPLRGRAQLELEIHAFDLPTMAAFTDLPPAVAFGVHAVVGGVPGYLVDLLDRTYPRDSRDVGRWLVEVACSPRRPLVHEARGMLEVESRAREPALYLSILGAMVGGSTRVSEIASRLRRPSDQIAHGLSVLADLQLVVRDEDLLRRGRPTWRIVDPLLRFHTVVLRSNWSLVEQADPVRLWQAVAESWQAQILGPHLEDLARWWAATADAATLLGSTPDRVGRARVNDASSKVQHEVDVVAIAKGQVVALGEAKLRPVDAGDVQRLRRIRSLLPGAEEATLLLVTADRAGSDVPAAPDVVVIGLDAMFAPRR